MAQPAERAGVFSPAGGHPRLPPGVLLANREGGDAGAPPRPDGDPDGEGPLVLRYDGALWNRLQTGSSGDLWWVFGFQQGPVFMGGEGGTILSFRDGSFSAMETPGEGTVFGIWGSDPNDLWAVGGDALASDSAFVWRYDGERWRSMNGLPPEALALGALFKVWGRGAEDVWLVGMAGMALHWDGAGFARLPTATSGRLLTVHALPGSTGRVATVGGSFPGLMLEFDSGRWVDATPAGDVSQRMGVWLTSEGGHSVGMDGTVFSRGPEGWVRETTGLESDIPLHAVWVDPEGGVWSVGGRFIAPPLVDGVMIHRQPAP